MKLSNEKIVRDTQRLIEISKKTLPVKVSFAIAKNIAKIESVLSVFNKEREKLISKYAVKDTSGKPAVDEKMQVKIDDNYIEDWNKEYKELLSIENEIDIHKFSIDELEGFHMSPAELIVINYMISE
jgi:hypothetical protein